MYREIFRSVNLVAYSDVSANDPTWLTIQVQDRKAPNKRFKFDLDRPYFNPSTGHEPVISAKDFRDSLSDSSTIDTVEHWLDQRYVQFVVAYGFLGGTPDVREVFRNKDFVIAFATGIKGSDKTVVAAVMMREEPYQRYVFDVTDPSYIAKLPKNTTLSDILSYLQSQGITPQVSYSTRYCRDMWTDKIRLGER